MRHHLKGRKFSRPTGQRKALLMSLASSLLRHEQIMTTLAKAKDLRSYVEKLITIGREGSLAARRHLMTQLRDKEVIDKVLTDLKNRYQVRPGGYTRIVKAGFRKGDNAPMAIIELVDRVVTSPGTNAAHQIKKGDKGKT